jgi:hypothetical protein
MAPSSSLTKSLTSDRAIRQGSVGEWIVGLLFLIYIIMGYRTPEPLASWVDTNIGKVVVVVLFLCLFAVVHPLVGVLGLLVAFQLIRQSAATTGSTALAKYQPNEARKSEHLSAFNQFPYTLEQEVVKKMTPQHSTGYSETQASYKPVLPDLHDATPLGG